ncbi:hypothetical protein [Natrononativus amylolyticus]|uniref:hypothetical protein n=1 Tax=Natrononativus amylolyticus TaxID=2963434 RepID=UPI0020CD2840|nr:hypothetical protein [Natrononativus amylolyticus]
MDVPARNEDERTVADREPADWLVTSHETRPGKVVFTERNNTDGWIATDIAVDLEP